MDCCTNQMGPGNTVPMGPGPVIQPRASLAGMGGSRQAAAAGGGSYQTAAGAGGFYQPAMAGAGGQLQPMAEAIDQYPIAMAYVPWQRWKQTYQLDQALNRGTIFPELDKPFLMGRCS